MANFKLEPFDLKYANDYFKEFNEEIAMYQWPDPFESLDDAKGLLTEFVEEMEREETLVFSVLSESGEFLGSTEVHGLEEDCPELGVWIKQSAQKQGLAYKALKETLDYAFEKYGKKAFFYEADVRNEGSKKLLDKFATDYNIEAREPEKLVTDSGKKLELQGFIMTRKN